MSEPVQESLFGDIAPATQPPAESPLGQARPVTTDGPVLAELRIIAAQMWTIATWSDHIIAAIHAAPPPRDLPSVPDDIEAAILRGRVAWRGLMDREALLDSLGALEAMSLHSRDGDPTTTSEDS